MKKAPSYETQDLREFAEVLRGRRTVNLYLQTRVPEELVHEAIEVATWAPNHHVTEPWRFIMPGKETVEMILDLCQQLVTQKKGAELASHKRESWAEKPGWLIVTCQRSDDELREQEDYAACCGVLRGRAEPDAVSLESRHRFKVDYRRHYARSRVLRHPWRR